MKNQYIGKQYPEIVNKAWEEFFPITYIKTNLYTNVLKTYYTHGPMLGPADGYEK